MWRTQHIAVLVGTTKHPSARALMVRIARRSALGICHVVDLYLQDMHVVQ